MSSDAFQWENYYTNISGRPPRDLLIDVLGRFDAGAGLPRRAIDLGCGDGTETAFLLANGWHVLAIDSEPLAFQHLSAKIPSEAQERLQTQLATFETALLSPADLIYAGFSIPFCQPQSFDALWHKIVTNITPAGRFAGQLFGVHDTWASRSDMTFFTEQQARALFTSFEVEYFREEDEDGHSTIVGAKHWHIFHIIARKN
jgi:trans-aconitate methyltransferase